MTITYHTFEPIGTGLSANDGTGDSLREAFTKVNANFGWISNTGFVAKNISVTSDVEIAGNSSVGGAIIAPGFQQLKPTSNIAITANVGVSRLLLHPTGTIISFGANVTLPNTQVNGTVFSVSSNVTISSLAITPNWNGVVSVSPFGNIASVTAGTNVNYIYVSADNKWYRI